MTFFQKVGGIIKRGAGALAQGAANLLGTGGGTQKNVEISLDLGGITTNRAATTANLSQKEKREAKKAGVASAERWENFKAFFMTNWYWFLLVVITIIGILVWVFGRKKKKVGGSRTRTRARKSPTVRKSVARSPAPGSNKTLSQIKAMPRNKWSKADWKKYMASIRPKK